MMINLFGQDKADSGYPDVNSAGSKNKNLVPDFKKNCLVEFIKQEWKGSIRGKLTAYESLCKYTN